MQVTLRSSAPIEGDTRQCPQCRQPLVYNNHYPILAVGMALIARGIERGDRIRYARAWVCRNGACDYRDIVEDGE